MDAVMAPGEVACVASVEGAGVDVVTAFAGTLVGCVAATLGVGVDVVALIAAGATGCVAATVAAGVVTPTLMAGASAEAELGAAETVACRIP
jgi:hypothetical protein